MRKVSSDEIKLELEKEEYWVRTYEKLASKGYLTKEQRAEIDGLLELDKYDIINKLMNGEYIWSVPIKREIAKSGSTKKRVVYIYDIKDRYVIGVIYRCLSVLFRENVSERCFSYKTGVSTGNAIGYLKNSIDIGTCCGVKMDIHAYFNSVNEEKLSEMIKELFQDGFLKTMENLMLDNRVRVGDKVIYEYKSLCPGSALGSFFANYTLRDLDNYFDEIPEVVYARYSDDIIILTNNQYDLNKYIGLVIDKISQYGLEMNPDKYKYFTLGDEVEYLGLKIKNNGKVDISDHSKQKMKKQIHRWCRKGRMSIERDNASFDRVARNIIKRWNNKNFKCIVNNETTFGWCIYAFRFIDTIETLIELDFYFKDSLRAMYTGKHNKSNHRKLSDEKLMELGYISLVELYFLYKNDYDYYREVVELL